MRTWGLVALSLLVIGGCAYVTEDELLEFYDRDLDGWNKDEDCADDPTNPTSEFIFPYAPDWRGDGCDADCGRTPDADGDDWPDDNDCDDTDATVYPCAPADPPGGADQDCDGDPDAVRATACPVQLKADPNYPISDTDDVDEGGLLGAECAFASVPVNE